MGRYDGFREFVQGSGPALSRTAYLLCGDRDLAEDLLHKRDDASQVDSQLDLVDPEMGEQRTVTRAPDIRLIAVRGSVSASG